MQRAIVVKGRLINPSMVELNEPVSEFTGDVEVVLRSVTGDQTAKGESMFEFLWVQTFRRASYDCRLQKLRLDSMTVS